MSSLLAERSDWGSRRGTGSLGMKRSISRTEKQRWHGKRGKLETGGTGAESRLEGKGNK